MRYLKAGKAVSVCLLAAIFALFLSFDAKSQDEKPYYWNTIQSFKRQDSLHAPVKNAILFIGSSSFTNWNFVQDMFPDYTILNRGFGGSQLPDIELYFEQVKYPPQVKQIVIYAGDNDIASGVNAEGVLERFQELYKLIRKDLPKVNVAYLSIKGCPGRSRSIPVVKEANELIKSFLSEQENAVFVDIYHPTMITGDEPMTDIYVEDGVHMNRKGYEIWASILKPYLKK
ncbi:GDSL-type esterase/lipase family protein [Desertivirga xinjiangensis]|uniref:GDSL-type esterase/lipase family protein n=1 Tax=Desertivirga xinjiangensis TaxID=539206 RepID=UPI00210D3A34|nr:GDSL-type esterase/lipase family protein [Pedobacter xinjiangensis]